jgi:serine protease Do
MKLGEVRAGMLPIHIQPLTWMLQQALGLPDLQGGLGLSVQVDGGTMLNGKIEAGDVVRTFNGRPVLGPRDLARKAARSPIGGDASLDIYRGGVPGTAHVAIQMRPEAKPIVLNDDGPRTLGLELVSVRGEDGKPIVKVASVDPAGKAADSGIRKDDTIVRVQETPVSAPDQALRIFWVRLTMKRQFAAVLVEHDKKLSWLSLAVPE